MPQRYFLDNNNHFSKQDIHHIKHVMRMKTGEHVIVCNPSKTCFLASVIVDENVEYHIIKEIQDKHESNITLIQGLPKGSKTDGIVKSGTLFGATHMIFIPFERSIAKLENIPHKLKRLQTIAKEAAELSHRQSIPTISFHSKFEEIKISNFDLLLLADEKENTQDLYHVLKTYHPNMNIGIIIGPEGGISDYERNYFKSHHAITVHLGPNILPTEYAHIYVLSALSLIIHQDKL